MNITTRQNVKLSKCFYLDKCKHFFVCDFHSFLYCIISGFFNIIHRQPASPTVLKSVCYADFMSTTFVQHTGINEEYVGYWYPVSYLKIQMKRILMKGISIYSSIGIQVPLDSDSSNICLPIFNSELCETTKWCYKVTFIWQSIINLKGI